MKIEKGNSAAQVTEAVEETCVDKRDTMTDNWNYDDDDHYQPKLSNQQIDQQSICKEEEGCHC